MNDEIRKPTPEELELIGYLISTASVTFPDDWFEGLMVRQRENDPVSGSVYLLPKGKDNDGRKYGQTVSEYQAEAGNGILIIASLNTDTDGNLYELDIWRGDITNPQMPSLN